MTGIGTALILLLGALYCGIGFLMAFKPMVFLEWWMNKPGKAWGVRTIVTDERRFRNCNRIMGALFLAIGISFPYWMLTAK